MHMDSHIVCVSTLNTPKFRIFQKKNSGVTKIEFESAEAREDVEEANRIVGWVKRPYGAGGERIEYEADP